MGKRPEHYRHNKHGRIVEGVSNPDDRNNRVYESQYNDIRKDFEVLRSQSPTLFNRVIDFILNAKRGIDLSTAHTPQGKRFKDLEEDLKKGLGPKISERKELEKKSLIALNLDKDGNEIPTLNDQYKNAFSTDERETINNLISWGINSDIVRNTVKDWKSQSATLSSTYQPAFLLQMSTSAAPETNSRYDRIEKRFLTTLQENQPAANVLTTLFEKGKSGDFSDPLHWFDRNIKEEVPNIRASFASAVSDLDRLEVPIIKEVIKNNRDFIQAL